MFNNHTYRHGPRHQSNYASSSSFKDVCVQVSGLFRAKKSHKHTHTHLSVSGSFSLLFTLIIHSGRTKSKVYFPVHTSYSHYLLTQFIKPQPAQLRQLSPRLIASSSSFQIPSLSLTHPVLFLCTMLDKSFFSHSPSLLL